MGSRSIKVGSCHSRDHFCHMNTLSREEKRLVLYFSKFTVQLLQNMFLICLQQYFFLKGAANQNCLKKNYPKIPKHIKKDIFNNIIYSAIYLTTLSKSIIWLAAFLTNSLEHLIIRLIVIN